VPPVGAPEVTDTVALCVAEPPVPVQPKVYVVDALIAPVDFEPLVARVPDQPPDAVHAVALVEDQVNVELSPLATPVGLALSETVGGGEVGGGAETVTVADWDAEPPDPVHVSAKLVVLVRGAVAIEPLVGSLPLQPPEPVQLWAPVAFQLKVTE
jgi:hypothetical protein